MEIRTATLDDIEQICLLYNEFFAYNAKLQPEYCKEANRFYEKNKGFKYVGSKFK